MKAPDKLFLHPNYRGEVGANWLTFPLTKKDECFIRKDALLDWIKAQLKENEEWREVNPDDRFFGGKEVAYNYVIEKINKL